MNRFKSVIRRAAAAGVVAVVLSSGGCSGEKPPSAPEASDALKKEAQMHKQLHDREARNR